ncbi:hypothetical protein MaudMau93_001628 [Microsporum audouinii]
MGRDRYTPNWIGNLFDNYKVKCPDGSIWRFDEKISEKSLDIQGADPNYVVAESQAVYHCHQTKGPSIGVEAIVKVRMQVPFTYPTSSDPFVRSCEACVGVAAPTATEVAALEHFTKKDCTVVPRLLHCIRSYQDIYMPVPGSYIIFLIIEKCPGVELTDFWDYDEAKRKKIRDAFRKNYTELLSCFADPADPGLRNIIYDEQENKCWFIDHEQTYILKDETPMMFYEKDFVYWGLEEYVPVGAEQCG